MANNDIMNFIQSYKSLVLLWDTSDKNYTNKLLRKEALGELSKQYNLSISEVKKKIKSLRSYFSKENRKAKESEDYVSAWFAYEAMSFIKDAVSDEDAGSPHQNNIAFTPPKPAHTTTTSTCNILKRKRPLVTGNVVDSPTTGEAYGLMGRVADVLTAKDESSSFGEMITFKLRRLSPRNRAIAQNRIGNLLFELEMEEFQMSSVQSTAVVSNTNSYSESMAQSGSVGYATQQSSESSHPDSLYVNDMCKVAMNS